MKTVDKEEHVVLSFVLLVITLFCLGVSFWSMATGYESMAGNIYASSAIAFILVLMMFAINYRLRRGLMQGIKASTIILLMIAYLIVVSASFSGMFNKFYSTFMHSELIKEELEEKVTALDDLQSRAMATLTSTEEEVLRTKVQGLLDQFKAQVKSPAEPGLGPKAKKILKDIENLIGQSITEIPPRGMSIQELTKYGEDREKEIKAFMENSAKMAEINAPEKRNYAKTLPDIIKEVKGPLMESIQAITNDFNPTTRADALKAIQAAVTVYKQIGSKTQSLVKESHFDYNTKMIIENDQVGKISHSYTSARKHIDKPSVWLAAAIALGIDLIVPLFVFLLTPKGMNPGLRTPRSDGAKQLSKQF